MSQKAFDRIASRINLIRCAGGQPDRRLIKRWANTLLKASKQYHTGKSHITYSCRRKVIAAGVKVYGQRAF